MERMVWFDLRDGSRRRYEMEEATVAWIDGLDYVPMCWADAVCVASQMGVEGVVMEDLAALARLEDQEVIVWG